MRFDSHEVKFRIEKDTPPRDMTQCADVLHVSDRMPKLAHVVSECTGQMVLFRCGDSLRKLMYEDGHLWRVDLFRCSLVDYSEIRG